MFNARELEIMAALKDYPTPATDRQIMGYLDYCEPNCVRPRITHLIQMGVLMEVGSVRCPVTGKTVRQVGFTRVGKQQEFQLA